MRKRGGVVELALAGALSLGTPRFAHADPTNTDVQSTPAVSASSGSSRASSEASNARWAPKRDLHVGVPDFVVAGAGGAVTLGAALVDPQPRHAHGGVLFDDAVRDALRIDSEAGRTTIRNVSNVTVAAAIAFPVVIDAVATTWGVKKRPDVAWKMLVIDAEAFALAGALQGITNVAVSRERPYGRTCAPDDARSDCTSAGRYRSFFSGHTTFSFTGAGLVCAQHIGLQLFGTTGDVVTCGSALAVAAATGVFRIAADMHYASDVLVGAVVGTTIGLGIPWLHMKVPGFSDDSARVRMQLTPIGQGLGVIGTF